mgnify:CR=1
SPALGEPRSIHLSYGRKMRILQQSFILIFFFKFFFKKIKIIPIPKDIYHAKHFIESIVSPVTFKNLEVKDNEMILTAGSRSKAAL